MSIEKMQSRIDRLEFYHNERYSCPSVNVKVHGKIKSIDEISKGLKIKEPFLSESVSIVTKRDESEYGSYFWNTCEYEQGYAMEYVFDGVAHNSDDPEQKHIRILNQYKNWSGFFGRSGGHFCIGVSKSDLESILSEAEAYPEESKMLLSDLSDLLDAIEWGLQSVKIIASGVPESIEDRIKNDLEEEADILEKEQAKKDTPQYKIDELREWEKTLSKEERDKLHRSIVSIEKMLLK